MSEIAKQPVTTKEVFDAFYGGTREETDLKLRCQVDRREVYDFEKKIGKQLFEMNSDELFEMISTFGSKRKTVKGSHRMWYNSFYHICSIYRQIFNYYIDNYVIIKNPFNDKSMRGNTAINRLMENYQKFGQKDLDDIIDKIHHDLPEVRANYVECIIRLFCDGFATNEEIALLKEDMIDFKMRKVFVGGRVVNLSERTMSLLMYVHNLEEIEANHGFYKAVPYRGGYFKFSIFPRNVPLFDEKKPGEIAALLSQVIVVYVRRPYGMDVNGRTFYLFGFYKKLVGVYGEERVQKMITSVRNTEDINDLTAMARLYGISVSNITMLKKSLRIFE